MRAASETLAISSTTSISRVRFKGNKKPLILRLNFVLSELFVR